MLKEYRNSGESGQVEINKDTMNKLYDNQVDKYVFEPYDKELDGPMFPLTKVKELADGFTLCENAEGYKFVVKNHGKKNKKVFVVCNILEEQE